MIMIDQKHRFIKKRSALSVALEIMVGAVVLLAWAFCLSETYFGWVS
jgi:hypothetical protein